jgi:hypothetical protein
MDERLSLYDWVADTGTTSHITNRRDAFITYQALGGKIVSGVGGLKTTVQGTGTVEVESIHDGHKYLLRLENTLYIPLGNGTGYPGVFQSNPHPYPSKPVPASTGAGFRRYGSGVYKNPWVSLQQ